MLAKKSPGSTIRRAVWLAVLVTLATGMHDSTAFAKTVGVVMTGDIPYYQKIHGAFTRALTASGESPEIVVQSPGVDLMSWTNAVRKLVTIKSDVIVAYGAPAALVAVAEAKRIPIVYAGVYGAESVGVKGDNVTGISSDVPIATVIRYLKEIKKFTRLGVMLNKSEKDTLIQAKEAKDLETKYEYRIVPLSAGDKAVSDRMKEIDALLLTTSCSAAQCLLNVTQMAREGKIPTAAVMEGGEDGVVLTLAADGTEQGQAAAEMVAQVLKGTPPSSIPQRKPRKVNVVLNIRAAKEIGLTIPFEILSSASSVIK